MFSVVWWYMLATYGAIWAGVLADPVWIYAAIGLSFIQLIHFGSEDRNFFTLTSQVRYGLMALLAAGLWEPLHWVYWMLLAGLTARLMLNYCFMARLLSLLPWNRQEPFTWELLKRRIFSVPVKGQITTK